MTRLSTRALRAAASAVGVVGSLGSVGALAMTAGVGPAAAGILPSTTTVTASPASSYAGQSVTLTATVSVLGLPGLGVTPTGSVNFTSTDGTHTYQVGTATIGSCLLTTCTASVTTTSLPEGTTSVTASFVGDTVANPSSGSTPESVKVNPSPGPSSTVTCYQGEPCDTGLVQADPTTTLDVTSDPSGSTQTLSASLTASATLHFCTATSAGELATFSSTATDAAKKAFYTVYGSAKTALDSAYTSSGTLYLGCFASVNPFNGYTSGVYGPAPQVNEPGIGLVYEVNLGSCANNSGAFPCFHYTNGLNYSTVEVDTNPGDPRYTGP